MWEIRIPIKLQKVRREFQTGITQISKSAGKFKFSLIPKKLWKNGEESPHPCKSWECFEMFRPATLSTFPAILFFNQAGKVGWHSCYANETECWAPRLLNLFTITHPLVESGKKRTHIRLWQKMWFWVWGERFRDKKAHATCEKSTLLKLSIDGSIQPLIRNGTPEMRLCWNRRKVLKAFWFKDIS